VHLGRPPLRLGRVDRGQRARVQRADRVPDVTAGDVDLGRDLGDRELDALLSGERLAEGAPFPHVVGGPGQRRRRRAERGDGDRQPLKRQVLHQVDEAPAGVAEHVLGRHAHVGEEQLGRVLRVQADLAQLAPALEARRVPLDDEQPERRRPGLPARPGPGDDDDQVRLDAVGDEGLGPVQYPVVAVGPGAAGDALQVAAGRRLGHRDRADQLARAQPRQPTPLLGFGAEPEQVGEEDVVLQREAGVQAGGADRRELLRQYAAEPVVGGAAAPEAFRDGEAEQSVLARRQPGRPVDDPPLVPLLEAPGDLAADELAHGGPEVLVLGLEEIPVPVHGGPFGRSRLH
jgi:hypothetical protein